MKGVDNRRLAFSLKWGFASDKIVDILKKYVEGTEPSDEDKEVLIMAQRLFDMILKGEEQANSGNYGMNFLESIKIYNRSMSIINTREFISNISDESTRDIIINMNLSLDKIIKSEPFDEALNRELLFFDLMRELTLNETEDVIDGFYESKGMRKWSHLQRSI